MGDLEFWGRLRTMADQPKALIEFRDPSGTFPVESAVSLTPFGQEVLFGEKDWVKEKGCEEWYGGLHLSGEIGWRWDRIDKRLI